MRWAGLLIAALALGGCGDRRDFDTRYNDTSAELANEARALDENMAAENLPAAIGNNVAEPAR